MGSIKRVLLLDDCATIRTILKVYLMNLCADLLEAADALGALELLRKQPVDLVIADVRMAPVDGIAFVERLRAAPLARLRNLPVILLTGDQDQTLKERGLAAGANAFVHKPISAARLFEAIEAITVKPA
jgi:two-component system chemotaxis response regulator CheY